MTTALRSDFADQEVRSAYAAAKQAKPFSPYATVAKLLTGYGRGTVLRQTARDWCMSLDAGEGGHTPVDDEISLQTLRESRHRHVENLKLRKKEREVLDALQTMHEFEAGVAAAVERLNRREFRLTQPEPHPDGTPMTVELLFSDLQIGKLGHGYNTPTAIARMQEYTRAAIFQIKQKQEAGYNVERIVLALLGDLVESDKKHKNSARATDCGTAEQMALVIEHLYIEVIEPLALLGIPLEIKAVTGNHDHDDHGIMMYQPGKEHLSYPMYKALEMITRQAGLSSVTWDIPFGTFCTTTFYGQVALYEHGVGVSVTEASMRAHKIKRAEQLEHPVTYFRMGDKHTVSSFNSGQYIVNGAFFGTDKQGREYSSIAGFSSVAAQVMAFHVPRKDTKMTIYDNYIIQLGAVDATHT